jgi:DNA-binding transcriptional LysR family regulator
MELEHVRIFVMLAETLNFSKVAGMTFRSQPSITKYMQILETELGGKLFTRSGRHMELTAIGEAFLPYAYEFLDGEDRAKEYLRGVGRGLRYEHIRIGVEELLLAVPPDLFFLNFVRAINILHKNHPEVRVSLKYYKSNEINAVVENEQIDIGIRHMTSSQSERSRQSDIADELIDASDNFIGVSEKMATAFKNNEVIADVDLFMVGKDLFPQEASHLFMRQYGISPNIRNYNHWTEMYLALLMSDDNVAAILPGNMRKIAESCGIVLLDFDDFSVQSELRAFWKKSCKNPFVQPVLNLLVQEFRRED